MTRFDLKSFLHVLISWARIWRIWVAWVWRVKYTSFYLEFSHLSINNKAYNFIFCYYNISLLIWQNEMNSYLSFSIFLSNLYKKEWYVPWKGIGKITFNYNTLWLWIGFLGSELGKSVSDCYFNLFKGYWFYFSIFSSVTSSILYFSKKMPIFSKFSKPFVFIFFFLHIIIIYQNFLILFF